MTLQALIPPHWAHDRLVQEMVDTPLDVHDTPGAIVVVHRHRRGIGILASGEARGCAELLQQVDPAQITFATMPRGTWELLDEGRRDRFDLPDSEDWDWMEIDHVPRAPMADRVREIDLVRERAVLDRVRALAIPNSFLTPDHPGSRWYGWEDEAGVIRAIGGAMGWDGERWTGGAHYGSIGTEPGWEGQGIGSALTAGMVAAAFAEGATTASLGVYVGNERAIGMYLRLGFHTTYQVHSRHREQ